MSNTGGPRALGSGFEKQNPSRASPGGANPPTGNANRIETGAARSSRKRDGGGTYKIDDLLEHAVEVAPLVVHPSLLLPPSVAEAEARRERFSVTGAEAPSEQRECNAAE
jgi:hypothetical protein